MSDVPRHPSTYTPRALQWTIFLGATALVVYWCLQILSPFLDVIVWSSVLAITFHPLHQYVVRKTGRVTLSAFISSCFTGRTTEPVIRKRTIRVETISPTVASARAAADAS